MSLVLQQQAISRVDELAAVAATHYRMKRPQIDVRFDLKGLAAGEARLSPTGVGQIRFNTRLLVENSEDFLLRTVPHEVAHIVAYRLHGSTIKPHGPEWKAVMELFGAEASRCHSYDTSASQIRRLKRFSYRCDCRVHQLTSIRHNRAKRGQQYICKACHQVLTFQP